MTARPAQTKRCGVVSSILPINASVIQCSALGPLEYVFIASDLHPISDFNQLYKYADIFLLVPSSNSLSTTSNFPNNPSYSSRSSKVIDLGVNRKRISVFFSYIFFWLCVLD